MALHDYIKGNRRSVTEAVLSGDFDNTPYEAAAKKYIEAFLTFVREVGQIEIREVEQIESATVFVREVTTW